jgi:hypothetical protein
MVCGFWLAIVILGGLALIYFGPPGPIYLYDDDEYDCYCSNDDDDCS